MTGGWTARGTQRAQRLNHCARGKDCADRMERLDGEIKTVQEELSAAQAAIPGVDGELATAQEDRIRCESEQAFGCAGGCCASVSRRPGV